VISVGETSEGSADSLTHAPYAFPASQRRLPGTGRLRLRLAGHDFVMKAGEAAEFDTRVPHWFGSAGPEAAEVLVLFGPQGERMHVRARPRASGLPGRIRDAIGTC
jgi:hypothetical protein